MKGDLILNKNSLQGCSIVQPDDNPGVLDNEHIIIITTISLKAWLHLV